MSEPPIQQAESSPRTVTSRSRRPGTAAAERKRQQRERDRQLLFQTEDWQLFLDLATLPQKAGCHPAHLRQVVLKELVDNALDAGGNVMLERRGNTWIVRDDGPGLKASQIPRLFSVNRPLLSSKLRRLPLRGMLGNGLRVVTGAIAATNGSLIVETRGERLALATCPATGQTRVVAQETIPQAPGLTVSLSLGSSAPDDDRLARETIIVSRYGEVYRGPSSPWWYGAKDLHKLFTNVTPTTTTVGAVCQSLGLRWTDERLASTLSREETAVVLDELRTCQQPVTPAQLGTIGPEYQADWPGYAYRSDVAVAQTGARIPYVVEAWVSCSHSEHKGQGRAEIALLLNRSMSVARINAAVWPGEMVVRGCGLQRRIEGPRTGRYEILLSIIAPHIQLATDGKEPSLSPFSEAVAAVISKACGAAHRAMHRPDRTLSVKEAAWAVMEKAYWVASGGERKLPANARQIMYAARPAILQLTGKEKLDDAYFTQTLLPDYVAENGKEAEWDVVFDARGTFTEPHTGREVRLGTIEVRDYVAQQGDAVLEHCRSETQHGADVPADGSARLFPCARFSTVGPRHRYAAVLFIEKEGFAPLLRAARIAERFDIAVMSTKGMSTTAARQLLDQIAGQIDKVLVLHDFDVSGFSIFGTLGADGRRYRFRNDLPIVDIGLRLADVELMDLQSEGVAVQGSWDSRSRTLVTHGASHREVAFLRDRRVELNAMPAGIFIDFLERKLAEQGVRKIVPDHDILVRHARDAIEQQLIRHLLHSNRWAIRKQAGAIQLPSDLQARVRGHLLANPEQSWDEAVAVIANGLA